MYSHFLRTCAAGLLLTLSATIAVAGEDAAVCKDPASRKISDVASPAMSCADNTALAEKASKPAVEDKARAAGAEQSAQKPPRRPDTAGWRRIMSGAGRT